MALTPEEIAEFERRAQQEEFEQRAQQEEAAKQGAGVNAALPATTTALASAGTGALIGSKIGSAADTAQLNQISKPIPPVPGIGPGPVKPPPIARPIFPVPPTKPTLENVNKAAPGVTPGQAWMAGTGYGSGQGYSVKDVVEAEKAQNAPIGSGKIAKNVTGPLNISGIMSNLELQSQDKANINATRQQQAENRAAIQARNAELLAEYQRQKLAHAEAVNKLQEEHAAAVRRQNESHNYDLKEHASKQAQHTEDVNKRNQALFEQEQKQQAFKERPFHKTGKFRSGVVGALTGLATSPIVEQGVKYLLGDRNTEEHAAGGAVGHYDIGGGVKKILKASEALAPHEGKTLLATLADRTKATEGFHGGPGFINLHPDYTWAVDAPAVVTKHMQAVQKFGGPDKTVFAPMLMSAEAHKSNRPVFHQIYKDLNEKIKSGEFTPEQIQRLNARILAEKGVDLSKSPGVESPDFLNFADTFNRRGKVADILGLKKTGGVDLAKHLESTIDPNLKGAETGAIGPQLFTIHGSLEKPDVHPAYSQLLLGEKGEHQFTPVPREFLFRDLEKQANQQMGRPMTDYNYRNVLKEHGGLPNQFIDEKLLRALQDLGYKEGGSTTPAWQRKEGKNPSGGLNAAGRASYNRETGGHLKPPQPEGGPRKRSFCARMEGNPGPMKDEHGKPTRKALALRKWKC